MSMYISYYAIYTAVDPKPWFAPTRNANLALFCKLQIRNPKSKWLCLGQRKKQRKEEKEEEKNEATTPLDGRGSV